MSAVATATVDEMRGVFHDFAVLTSNRRALLGILAVLIVVGLLNLLPLAFHGIG